MKCGRLNSESDVIVFTVSQLNEIERVIIPIFEKFTLNTTKYLDYLDFKNAFFIFKNRKSSELVVHELYSNIIRIKEGMNSKRVVFDLPKDHIINITGNYLVGFLEGDGTFYLSKHDMSIHFSLVTTTINKNFLLKIREFLLNLLDEHSYLLGSTTKLINIIDKKSNNGHRAVSLLDITQIDFVYNILTLNSF